MSILRFLTLRSNPGALPQFPSYAFASRVQTVLQQELLAWKALPPSSRGPPPPPSLICFTPTPTYTLGRRQTEPLSETEVARLRSPLFVPTSSETWGGGGRRVIHARANANADINREDGPGGKTAFFLPAITHAPRGGLTTYHGPGQLVIWPVIDLHSPLHARLSVRDYACLLEKTTIAALGQLWGLEGFTTANPGVWVRSRGSRGGDGASDGGVGEGGGGGQGQGQGQERKIAALGVHLRRHVTGLGVAINYSMPVTGPAETNPWGRIVACGLGDLGVTSVCAELGISGGRSSSSSSSNNKRDSDDKNALESLADTWRSEFQKRLKMHEDAGNVASFDVAQSMRDLGAMVKDSNDYLVQALPLSNLET
ncbi:hypothetical protein GGR51DRAFT_209122 [Nemania sp. FL0031]|nr:hypothetical protein GGR51DRAFT_209122 [Nemania sp. FL0031]